MQVLFQKGLPMNKLPSYFTLLAITLVAYFIEHQLPLVGSSISAILLGTIVAHSPIRSTLDTSLIKSTSGSLLKVAIVFFGVNLSFSTLSGIGFQSLIVTLPLMAIAFATAFLVGEWFRIPLNTRLLIGAGTAICGGSAIAATAPIVEAEDDDIAFSIATIFIFNLAALFVFPVVGQWLGYSDMQFGIFAGTAINDTSSVVAAGFAFSEEAGSIATVVKLVRTLMIVPMCLLLIYHRYRAVRSAQTPSLRDVKRIIPQFIVWFVVAVIIATIVKLPSMWISHIKFISRFMMTMALAAVGLSLNFKQLRTAGATSILLGGITWFAVIVGSITFIALFFT